jgi:hypothetical protein
MDQDKADRMELAHGLRLAAIALTSAVVTASLVIAVGGAWLDHNAHGPATAAAPPLIRTAG